MLGYIAKAITAFIISGLVYLIGDVDVVHSAADEIEALILALLTALGVFAVPNTAPVARSRRID